ncbi:hypothetical protein KP509_31G031500 [Ceratopteris richardii]|uniref:Uncharacterized protein n=1 Tax=Ceratopteris richardii TaxID=49495 RepID=A0A8T2QYP5_CERRI|nr:hypothetical protein KP509_31G031500 [Ceratopteris richardii]
MPAFQDASPLRRPARVSSLFRFAKDLPKDLTMLRMQVSFKEGTDYYRIAWGPSLLLRFLKPVVRCFKPIVILVIIMIVLSAILIYGSGLLLERANFLGRQCVDLKVSKQRHSSASKFKFAMVTCQDGGKGVPGRSFEGLADLVSPNKRSYAKRHGYDFIDASSLLDRSRPPSWSKILAVRKHLPHYDWVFWNDADSLVTNPTIALDDIIDSIVGSIDFENMPDFIVTEDVTGINAGMFFFRNSTWSIHFLDRWWNQTSFVRPFGQRKSGDNDALKFLINDMQHEERKRHVRIPSMQCVFNSNPWLPTWKSGHRLMTLTKTVWKGLKMLFHFISFLCE